MADHHQEEEAPESPSGDSGDDHQIRKRRRGLLRMYYGVDENGPLQEDNPLDIDKSGFKSQLFMEKVLKESSLNQLYRQEERMKKEIQELDSNMQYLVYENHSKFIKASETIREMKDDFQHLEDDMTHLSSRMEEIISSSNSINSALSDRKREITKLCGVHHLLKKLQFLFELPTRLHKCIDRGFYAQAVRTYCKAQRVLEQYQHMPSFHGIQKDCAAIVIQLKSLLRDTLENSSSSTSAVAETVDLLLELNEPAEVLCQQYLEKSRKQLEQDLKLVTQEDRVEQGAAVSEEPKEMIDVQEYVGLVCSGFLANVSLVIQSCSDMFVTKRQTTTSSSKGAKAAEEALRNLTSFVSALMDKCLESVREKLKREAYHLDSIQLVRALDRISGKLQAMDQLLPSAELSVKGRELVSYVAEVHTQCHYQRLQQSFSDALMSVRHSLATAKSSSQAPSLSEHSSSLYAAIKSGLEVSLGNLKEFIEGNVDFSMKNSFREEFCMKNVRAGIVYKFITHVLDICKGFTESGGDHASSFPPTLILILSRLLHDMERSTISYLISYGDESFPPHEEGPMVATPMGEVLARAKDIAQTLLDHYVKVQGESISQMIRKSVETRDWLNTIEPRNVRSVMKRMVEEVTLIDKQVGALYKEGTRREQGSEGQGSRHTFNYSLTQGKGYPYTSHMDSSLLSNIQKLFYEKIEVFSTVEFSKLSITTGIIKIFLKAFLECVRLRTFGKFGLQQMQVDAHYLQIYLWRFVYDEQLVRVILEQVVSSTIERCVEPMPMEQSIVEVICEKT